MENENRKYILVRTDGTYSIVEFLNNDFIKEVRELLSISLVERLHLIENEYLFFTPLKSNGARLNFYASQMNQILHKGNSIYGDVIIGCCDDEVFMGLSQDQINRYVCRVEINGYENKCS